MSGSSRTIHLPHQICKSDLNDTLKPTKGVFSTAFFHLKRCLETLAESFLLVHRALKKEKLPSLTKGSECETLLARKAILVPHEIYNSSI